MTIFLFQIKDFVKQMETKRVAAMNVLVRYLEAVEEAVRIGHLNYKILAEDFYNVFCEHVFFATFEVCEPQFYQVLIRKDFNDVKKRLKEYVNIGHPGDENGKYISQIWSISDKCQSILEMAQY